MNKSRILINKYNEIMLKPTEHDIFKEESKLPSFNKWHKHTGDHYTYEDRDGYHWEINNHDNKGYSLVVRGKNKKSSWKWITKNGSVSNIPGVKISDLFVTAKEAAKVAQKVIPY